MSQFGGHSIRQVAVLEEGMKYTLFHLPDSAVLETRKFQINEIVEFSESRHTWSVTLKIELF
jgi:hypothetical protein